MNRSIPPSPPSSSPLSSTTFPTHVRFAFLCDHHDHHAQLVREYILFYYPHDNSVELYDTKQKRTFLRRTILPSLSSTELILGTTVTIFARQLILRDYADSYTKSSMSSTISHIHLLIPQQHMIHLGSILTCFWSGFAMVHDLRMLTLLNRPRLIQHVKVVDNILFHAGKQCAIAHVVAMDPSHIPVTTATTTTTTNNNNNNNLLTTKPINLSDQFIKVQKDWPDVQQIPDDVFNLLFSLERPEGSDEGPILHSEVTNIYHKTLLVIKPHAVLEGKVGPILQDVQLAGFYLHDIQTFVLSRPDAEDFLEIYKGVLPEYNKLVDQLTSGPLVAVELHITGNDNAVTKLRELAGPYDPTLGQVIKPNSLRAKYGQDKVKNAVHCTDLVEDVELEIQFFFRLMV